MSTSVLIDGIEPCLVSRRRSASAADRYAVGSTPNARNARRHAARLGSSESGVSPIRATTTACSARMPRRDPPAKARSRRPRRGSRHPRPPGSARRSAARRRSWAFSCGRRRSGRWRTRRPRPRPGGRGAGGRRPWRAAAGTSRTSRSRGRSGRSRWRRSRSARRCRGRRRRRRRPAGRRRAAATPSSCRSPGRDRRPGRRSTR